jgi:hypothetical protein
MCQEVYSLRPASAFPELSESSQQNQSGAVISLAAL